MKFEMPYGNGFIEINIPDSANVIELKPKKAQGLSNIKEVFLNSLNNPIKTEPLKDILKEKKGKIIIVVDDHTRKFPNKIILPILIDYLNESGCTADRITFLVASGTHSPPNENQMNKLFGDLLKEYKFEISNIETGEFSKIGTTTRGTPVLINKLYLNADIRILLTDITLHYFAGFGGDRKSIIPGVSAPDTVNTNHKMVTQPGIKTGKLIGNPIHEDMLEGARMIGADFVVNICTNEDDEIFCIKSGALNDAFLAAVSEFRKYFIIQISKQADLLILCQGGDPYDISYYQTMKSLHQSKEAVQIGGAILFLSECSEGIGSKVFLDWIQRFPDSKTAKEEIKKNFVQGANHVYFQYEYLKRNTIYMKSEMPINLVENILHMNSVKDVNSILTNLINKSKLTYIIRNGTKIMIDFQN